MNNTVSACLFGGAIFSAGTAQAQEWQIAYGQYGTTSATVACASSPTMPIDCDGGFNYTLNNSYASVFVGGSGATARVTTTIIDGFAGTSGAGGGADSNAGAYVTVTQPTTVLIEWGFIDPSPFFAGPQLFSVGSLDPVTFQPLVDSGTFQWSMAAYGMAGSTTVVFQPGVLYLPAFFMETSSQPNVTLSIRFTALAGACIADCDGSGTVNIDDVDCFVAAFMAGDLGAADCDRNGVINIDDVDCFVASFLAGCP